MDVVYLPPHQYPNFYPGDTIRKTRSTESEAGRIMNWNYDIAKTDTRSAYGGAATLTHRPRYIDLDEDPIVLRRSVTTSTIIEDQPYSTSPARDASKTDSGMSAASAGMYGLLGAAMGAAAGAAVTYGMMSKDRSNAPRQEFDNAGPVPSFSRRSTYPEQKVNYATTHHYHHHGSPSIPGQRYVELERTVEKIRYPEDFAATGHYSHHPPAYVARYSQVGGPSSSRKPEVLDDSKSRYSSSPSKYQRGDRSVREAPTVAHVPLLLTEAEHRSNVGSSASRHSTVKPPPDHRSSSYAGSRAPTVLPAAPVPPPGSTSRRSTYESTTDRDTYVSARSRRSSGTLRAERARAAEDAEPYGSYPPRVDPTRGSRVGSRAMSSATVRGREREVDEAPATRSHSRASTKFERLFPLPNNPVARHYPLPPSHDGMSMYSAQEMPLPQQSSVSGRSHRSSRHKHHHHHHHHHNNNNSHHGSGADRKSHYSTREVAREESDDDWNNLEEDDDDDAVSLAPSDSISCVGSKTKKSSRSRRR